MKIMKRILFLGLLAALSIGSSFGPSLAADIPEPQADKALVVFYRAKSMKGAAIGFNVKQGSAAIGTLASGTVFHRYVDPGQHTFWTEVISQDSVTIDAQAGKTYFIEGISRIGLVVARPQLRLVEEAEARAALASLK